MPRQAVRKQFLNFVGGLNTEASLLIFPENTARALDNVDLLRDGSIRRRRGLEYEPAYAFNSCDSAQPVMETAAITTHEWQSVDGNDTLNFVVVQVGGCLYFHSLGQDTVSNAYLGRMSLEQIQVVPNYYEFPLSTTYIKGKLFIVSRGISPAFIEYDSESNTFIGRKLTIKIRDIDGVIEDEESLPVFGDSITPGAQVSPDEDIFDVLIPEDIFDFGEFYPYDGGL